MAREGLRVLALAKGVRAPGSPAAASPGTVAVAPGVAAASSSCGMVFVGLVGLHDPPRHGVVGAVRTLRASGVRVCMITGDSRPTALAIAAHLGLIDDAPPAAAWGGDSYSSSGPASPAPGDDAVLPFVAVDVLAARGCALSGAQVEALSGEALAAAVAHPALSVFYRTTPQHKMRICQAFQACGLVCAMTGDVRVTNPCECAPAALCFHMRPPCPGR
jgi:magnesium-transporting ATPase (P-type)